MDDEEFINSKEPVNLSIDIDQLKTLMQARNAETPEGLMYSLFQQAYRCYVTDKDELVSKREYEHKLAEMKRDYVDRLTAKKVRDKQTWICPTCNARVKWDDMKKEYVCRKCDWQGSNPIYED